MEVMKKPKTEGRLDMKNLGKQTGTTEKSITNRKQEILERLSGAEDTLVEIASVAKASIKSKNFLIQNIQENLRYYERMKPKK